MFSQYILILLWMLFLSVFKNSAYRIENVLGKEELRIHPAFAFLLVSPLIFMVGLRGNIGDTYAYINAYQHMPDSFMDIPDYMVSVQKDKGFSFFSAIIRCIFGSNYLPYLFIIAIIQVYLTTHFFRKYSTNFLFSMFLFIASSDYIGWMFNGIRQYLAVVIILTAVPFILQSNQKTLKKYLPIIIIILIAATIHQTALLMIPFVIIAQGKAFNKRTILFIILALLAVLYVGQFTTLLNDTLQATQYANVVSDYTEWNDDGTNPIRVLVYSIPAILAVVGRKKIRKENNILINFSVNMSIISMGIYLVSMVTSGIFIGRLPIYCSLFSYILLPWEIEHLFDKNIGKVIHFISIVGYLGFYYYALHVQNGLI